MDVGISHNHSGWIDEGKYIPAEVYRDYRGEFEGVHLVLDQMSQGAGVVFQIIMTDIS